MTEKKAVRLILLFLFAIMIVLAFFSEGSGYGGGDSNLHMLISKFSFKYPRLFLHHWGKPFFILASSSFAQFGFFGMNVFNIICALSTAHMIYLLARKFKFENSWMAIFFSLFAPVYFVVIFSGLTEIFFCFILVLSIYLVTEKKYWVAAIVISFLPFVRSEGYLLFPLFISVFIYRKKPAAILLLATGVILYSIAGGIYYHDLFWLVKQNPYSNSNPGYGHGSLFYFAGKNEFIFGTALVVLLMLGLAGIIMKRNEKKIYFNEINIEEAVLLYGSFVVYFIAHSIFWWKGLYGSDGLIRVMAGITPLISLLALRGANLIFSFKNSVIIKAILLILVLIMPFKQNTFPRGLDYEEATLNQANNWLAQKNLATNKIFFAHPFTAVELRKDPFDKNSAEEFLGLNAASPEITVKPGELVIWDSHFSPNEGGIPLEKLTGNNNFRMLNSFSSDPAVTPGKEIFRVVVFQRM